MLLNLHLEKNIFKWQVFIIGLLWLFRVTALGIQMKIPPLLFPIGLCDYYFVIFCRESYLLFCFKVLLQLIV